MWGLAPVLALSLCAALSGGCRPAPGAPASTSIFGYTAPATAAALPLSESRGFDALVDEQLAAFADKRTERLGMALEPEEHGLNVSYEDFRLGRKFDPIEAHFNAGEELFEFDFRPQDGLGDGLGGAPPNMHRVHRGDHGGPDTTSCRSCHHRGGDDGGGEYPENALTGGDGRDTYSAKERNAPALLGGGALQILAAEITRFLVDAYRTAPGTAFDRELVYQGTSFGTVHVGADGIVDTSGITAIDPDLVVRPFGWKGTHSTLRRFAEEAFQVHHGMQSEALVDQRQRFGPLPLGSSAATRALAAALGDGPPRDPDRDGRLLELHGGYLTAISVYLTLLPLPVIDPPRAPDLLAAYREGEAAFRAAACDGCHKPMWLLAEPVWQEQGETMFSQVELALDLRRDIRRGPKLDTRDTLYDGKYPLFVFSDLRRHDMGPGLSDPLDHGPHPGDRRAPPIPPSVFLTRPLWGLADTAPYLHDGRAATIPEAIVAHDGEAAASRAAYLRLPQTAQRALHVFLLSLTRPPVPEVVP